MSDRSPAEEREETAGGIPSPWGQTFPRSLRLAPDGLFVPCGTLRALLKNRGRLEIVYAGFALQPWVENGSTVLLNAARSPRPGDLVLCDVEGWGDLRRVLARRKDETWITGLDAAPGARGAVPAAGMIAVVVDRTGAGGALGKAIAGAYPCWSRIAALLYWFRKAIEAPSFGEAAAASVRDKYLAQAESYDLMVRNPPGGEWFGHLQGICPAGGSILVAGSGAGSEAIQLARAGYRVAGLDVLDEMVRRARRNAAAAGVDVEFIRSDMADLDLPGKAFDAIYVTPLVYSFVPGRERRVRSLRHLGRHLTPGAAIVFSAHLFRRPSQILQTAIAWARRRAGDPEFEFGDWFTWFLLPDGTIGRSFTHLFPASRVLSEVREAGFRTCRRRGAFFIAAGFEDETSR